MYYLLLSPPGALVSTVTVHPSSITGVKQIMPKALFAPGVNVLSHVVRACNKKKKSYRCVLDNRPE